MQKVDSDFANLRETPVIEIVNTSKWKISVVGNYYMAEVTLEVFGICKETAELL